MTNYEKIKNMSFEEMTKVFCHGDNGSCRDCPIAEDSQLCLDAQDVIKNWLEEDTEK